MTKAGGALLLLLLLFLICLEWGINYHNNSETAPRCQEVLYVVQT